MTHTVLFENKKPRFKNRGLFATPQEQTVLAEPTYFKYTKNGIISQIRIHLLRCFQISKNTNVDYGHNVQNLCSFPTQGKERHKYTVRQQITNNQILEFHKTLFYV